MAKRYITLKYEEFKAKFKNYFLHKKKIRALKNYCSVANFEGSRYIGFFDELLNDGFLDETESQFLDYQINKAEISWWNWAHRTKWLKGEMFRMKEERARLPDAQIYMDFDKKRALPVAVPVEILSGVTANKGVHI